VISESIDLQLIDLQLIDVYSMVIIADTDLVGSVTEVAVTVTELPCGIVGGAWYVVGTSLAIGFGENEPHWPAGTQLHVTPAFWGSFATTAAMPSVASVPSAVGGGKSVLNVTTMAAGWLCGSPQAANSAIVPAVTISLTTRRKAGWRGIIWIVSTTRIKESLAWKV
jgi:hypothetical protein